MSARHVLNAAAAACVYLSASANPARAITNVVMDFESLAAPGEGNFQVGPTYSEDGFTLTDVDFEPGRPGFASFLLDDARWVGSTGLFMNSIGNRIQLAKDDGGAFRLESIKLAPLDGQFLGPEPASVTFVGELCGVQVATQTFVTTADSVFQQFVFNPDFGTVDRVTWVQEDLGDGFDFHQFDDISLTPPVRPIIDFESLAQAGSGSANIGTSYTEDGFTITPSIGSLETWQMGSPNFAGSTGIWASNLSAIELVRDDGGAFRLDSVDLARLNLDVLVTTVTFTGFLDGRPVASQMFTTSSELVFQSFAFNDDFKYVDRVTWEQEFTPDTHQFDKIILDKTPALLESAELGLTCQSQGRPLNDQYIGCRFSLDQVTRITEIGGHFGVDNGTIWGAIIPLLGPGSLPPTNFDVEANALAHAIFDVASGFSEDRCMPVDAILLPGDYALVFGGAGLFGTTGRGRMPTNNIETAQASYFWAIGSTGTWIDGGFENLRFVVRGTPIPCTNCIGDANGDSMVDFGDVTTVLGNFLTVCSVGGQTILETANLGPIGQGGGWSLSATQWIGAHFNAAEPTRITGIGGHISTNTGGSLWGAIIPLAGPDALPPNGIDIEAEALASTLFTIPPFSSQDLLEPIDVTLPPGDYALVLGGSGPFESTDGGSMAFNNSDIGMPSRFVGFDGGSSWQSGGVDGARLVVVGEPLCASCDGDANFDGGVDFGDVTTVLGNWLAICP